MYAVIETGGKQVRVEEGDVVDLERLGGVEAGSEVVFDRVLMIGGGEAEPEVGEPVLEGARVRAQLVSDLRGPKIVVFKFKRRKGYRRRRGHRQELQRFRIEAIERAGGA
ncbi:MAG: 50S ribosomal protein L21 [Holophagales bacterium]|nr:50S ribosomal protein L21 [Holophagales bacterium]MXX60424.1 50S ribosomal protein L21 [Holophagales bacterium]MYC10075.1 50S ribosomal protein L21 [Holophagales bacterium]MYD21391.1 50S ribosomal protein L21 [Holophagales bacterium]MYI32645.1 50S ribosomal protein L21 [Holophagales bacterium]